MRTNNLIYNYLLIAQAAFAGIVFTISDNRIIITNFKNDMLLIILPVFAVFAIFGADFLFKKLIAVASTKNTLLEKLNVFRTASMIRYALVEAPTLFAIVRYLTEGNLLYLIIAVGLIIYFITLKPTAKRIIEALNLTYQEKSEFESQVGL